MDLFGNTRKYPTCVKKRNMVYYIRGILFILEEKMGEFKI